LSKTCSRHGQRAGQVCGVHIGTPCTSFSRIRGVGAGSGPLRSSQHPLGLPHLTTDKDILQVELGNKLMKISCVIFQACVRLLVPVTLENPSTSILWLTPQVTALLRQRAVHRCITDFCMWGKPWRNELPSCTPTSILGYWQRALAPVLRVVFVRVRCSRTFDFKADLLADNFGRRLPSHTHALCATVLYVFSLLLVSLSPPRDLVPLLVTSRRARLLPVCGSFGWLAQCACHFALSLGVWKCRWRIALTRCVENCSWHDCEP
jgi:hypothetical protein